MSLVQPQSWEVRLLHWAQEAFESQRLPGTVEAEQHVLEAAYHRCDEITRVHSKTFYVASGLLPDGKRQAARALYAFCRITDNIVDDPNSSDSQRLQSLAKWQASVMADAPVSDDLVCLAWADTQVKFNLPRGFAQQLIDGVRRDIDQTRYETFADLAEYSYGVASTVGLLAMHIVGFVGEQALPYAIRLGVALQLTNILRDVAEDWRNGRIYLPLDELHRFGLDESDIAQGQVDDRWRKFMAFQIERNRRLYAESLPGIAMLDRDGRFAIAAAADLYRAILDDIELNDYDVFSRRAHVNMVGKLSRLPRIWWRARRVETA